MRSIQISACFLMFALLSGCAAMAEKEALEKIKAHCAAEGKQFVQKHTETHEGVIISEATISGFCVGPGDPGYEPNKPSI